MVSVAEEERRSEEREEEEKEYREAYLSPTFCRLLLYMEIRKRGMFRGEGASPGAKPQKDTLIIRGVLFLFFHIRYLFKM